MADKHVESVRQKLSDRSGFGLRKYGTSLERDDLSLVEWLHHAQQEAMDTSLYLEVLIQRHDLRLVEPALDPRVVDFSDPCEYEDEILLPEY